MTRDLMVASVVLFSPVIGFICAMGVMGHAGWITGYISPLRFVLILVPATIGCTCLLWFGALMSAHLVQWVLP
jgi:hypothetical protein